MKVKTMLAGLFALGVCAPAALGQDPVPRSYIVCTIRDVAGPPERKQAFVIDDRAMSVNGISGGAMRSFTPDKIIWRDESFETTLDRVAGFVTINLLSSGDLYSSGPCVRTDGPRF